MPHELREEWRKEFYDFWNQDREWRMTHADYELFQSFISTLITQEVEKAKADTLKEVRAIIEGLKHIEDGSHDITSNTLSAGFNAALTTLLSKLEIFTMTENPSNPPHPETPTEKFHVKRFEEYEQEATQYSYPRPYNADVYIKVAFNNLCRILEQEHEARVELERRIKELEHHGHTLDLSRDMTNEPQRMFADEEGEV